MLKNGRRYAFKGKEKLAVTRSFLESHFSYETPSKVKTNHTFSFTNRN